MSPVGAVGTGPSPCLTEATVVSATPGEVGLQPPGLGFIVSLGKGIEEGGVVRSPQGG